MTNSDSAVSAGVGWDLDTPLDLHPLVYLDEGDEVTIGSQDVDSYGIFPPDGAELVRRLADGSTPRAAARWFADRYGEDVEIGDIIAALAELDLVRTGDASVVAPVRFRALATVVFSPAAWVVYGVLVFWALVVMVVRPDLTPHYQNIFFADYYTIIQVGLTVAAIPLVLLHESFHALAGRRLGLRSRLRIGRRLHFIVLETSLDGLVSVPRRKRYLPILAGMLADLVGVALFTVIADLTRAADGSLSPVGRFLLAVAFTSLLRVAWQFFFYLRTDLYVLISTALGCVDLHTSARRILGNRFRSLFGSRNKLVDESTLHPADRRAARWYSWLIVIGYSASLTMFVLAAAPALYRFVTGVLARLTGDAATTLHLLDSVVLGGIVLAQCALLCWLIVRDRRRDRRARRLHHVLR